MRCEITTPLTPHEPSGARPAGQDRDQSRPGGVDDLELKDLIARHGSSLFRLSLAITGSEALAEEVVQETLFVAWRSMPPIDGDDAVRWMRRVARNRAISVIRHESRSIAEDEWEWRVADSPAVERVVEGREMAQAMIAALEDLDEISRALVVLREAEDLPYAELAELFEMTQSAVKAKLYRARHRLKSSLREWGTR